MEMTAIAVAPSATPIILPAIALALAYKLLQDKSNPIGEMYENLNEELLIGSHSKDSPVNTAAKPKPVFFSDKRIQTKLEKFFNDFTKKQQEILDVTYNQNTQCINIGNLKINDYTPSTKTIFNSNQTIEPLASSLQDSTDAAEKTKEHTKSASEARARCHEVLQKTLFPITKSNDGSLAMPLSLNDDLATKIHDLESSRLQAQDIISANALNAGIMVYKVGALLKQTYKSIQRENLKDQEFEATLSQNSIAQVSYKKAIEEIWILFLKANSELIPPYERIEALLNLNKIYLPGKQGRLIQELVRIINALYFNKDGTLKLLSEAPKKELLSHFISLLLRTIAKNQEEAQSFIELSKYYELTDFEQDLKNNIINGFIPVEDKILEKIFHKMTQLFSNNTIDQRVILKNQFNALFGQMLKTCKLELSNPTYNPYARIDQTHLVLQGLERITSDIKLYNNYIVPLKKFIDDRSLLFDDFKVLKIFSSDPLYKDLNNKEDLLLDKSYRDKVFIILRNRYNKVAKIMQNLNLSDISTETQTFIYAFLDKQITLNGLLKEICNPNINIQILKDFCNQRGILKAFEERANEFPQLAALPSCLDHPKVLKLLNRYLMFSPHIKIKSFFDEGLNYLINSIDNDNQINFQYLNLAKAYYTLLNNAEDRSILMSSDSITTTGLNDFTCKYCVEFDNDYLNELSYVLRLAAKKLKTEADPYKKDLARFVIYAIQHLKGYNYSTNKEKIDSIIKYIKSTLMEPVNSEEFLGTFTDMMGEVKNSDIETDKLFLGSKLHKKQNKPVSAFITKALKLNFQRAEVNNFYNQLYYTKHPEFYNKLNYISTLCSSVLHKAETILDNKALEIAKTAEKLSFQANELAINIVPENIAKTNYIAKTTLDSLIIECQEYLKPFCCDVAEISIPTRASCLSEETIDKIKECGTGRTEEKTSYPSYCIPFTDNEKPIILCGTGPKIKSDIVVRPCNHSRMQGMISLTPSKNQNKEKPKTNDNPDKSKSTDKDITAQGEKEEPLPLQTQSPTNEQNTAITTPIKPKKSKIEKSGKLTPELSSKAIEKINIKKNQKTLEVYREFIVRLMKAKLLTDSKEYSQVYDKLINSLAARLKEINDIAHAKILTLEQILLLHNTPQETEIQKKSKKIRESLEIFNGSQLPNTIKNLEKIVELVNNFKNTNGAVGTDGPIARIVKEDANQSQNRLLGAIYELEKAKLFEKQGNQIIAFDRELLISDEQRKLWGISKSAVEFDIELADKFVEVKNTDWKFVNQFLAITNSVDELNYFQNLNSLKTIDTNKLEDIIGPNSTKNIAAKAIYDMSNFLQQAKAGNEMAQHLGKEYEFYSKHTIPPLIKEWLEVNKIKFFEKECTNCDCDKKYSSWCTLQ